ncbi:MAG: YjbQ family protein [candidate division Zixibacteria bacterium]|nr:YjbQ family protein [candidate division Zixibacteria bacterium]
MLERVNVPTQQREQLLNITAIVQDFVTSSGLRDGVVTLFVPHTTAAVTINENADPDVVHDILDKLQREFPRRDQYRHAEGNSDAHIKSSLTGPSLQIIVTEGRLVLGTWQGIYFCEFDGPRTRTLFIKTMAG